jgi:histidinol dehydrogenase
LSLKLLAVVWPLRHRPLGRSTEILVIADDHADPDLVACDLLGQAEHDP